jgi:two-component system OmpR family response regulator
MTPSLNILVADDQEIVRTGLSELLLSLGHACDVASDGKDCLKKAMQKSYDLIFLDLVMPNIDGENVLLSLRGKLSATKFVIISEQDDEDAINEMLSLGASAYLVKPAKAEAIIDVVGRICAGKTAAQTKSDEMEA